MDPSLIMKQTPAYIRTLLCRLTGQIYQLPLVSRVYLYGSYAKGSAGADSDLDLAVFFDSDKDCFLEEYRWLSRICLNSRVDVQAQAFSLRELKEPCGIIEEIVTYGFELDRMGQPV